MMSSRVLGMAKLSVVPALMIFALGGCGSRSTLPSTVVVDLPDGTTAEVEQGAGVTSLADTTWRFLRATGTAQGLPFLTISFGPEGNLEAFSDNTIASQVFGSEILFDGQQHSTSVSGVTYAASTYGAETVDGSGFTFAGRMTAWAGPIVVGQATATATGTFNPDDPNTMTGTFAFTTDINFVSIPEAEMDEEFSFVAHLVVE